MNTYGSVVSSIAFNLTITKTKPKKLDFKKTIWVFLSGKFVVIIPVDREDNW